MGTRTSVVSISSDHEEIIQRLAKHLGTDKIRRGIFDAVYGRVRRFQSKKEIMKSAGFSDKQAQQVQNQLNHLSKHHLISDQDNNGQVSDGSHLIYGKDDVVRANRDEIVKFADNRVAASKIPTKRNPTTRSIVVREIFSKRALKKKSRSRFSI